MTRGRAVAARVAHNHKVGGSSPPPATKIKDRLFVGLLSCWGEVLVPRPKFCLQNLIGRMVRRSKATHRNLFRAWLQRRSVFGQSQKCALSSPRYQEKNRAPSQRGCFDFLLFGGGANRMVWPMRDSLRILFAPLLIKRCYIMWGVL